ncbi:hypothetical protein [Sulfitobacter undariae]|nr:hypothetical protein [Sulfitobacter undariae]
MFKYALSIASLLIAAPVWADSDPKYLDPKVILADLLELQETCQNMTLGQTNEEVFGILFTRSPDGGTCQFQNGELDDHVRDFLQEQNLAWAGVEGQDGLWVKAANVSD